MSRTCCCPHWEEDDEGEIFLDSNREDARFDNLPIVLILVSVSILNTMVVVASFVFNSLSMLDVAVAGVLVAIVHSLYTIICRVVLGSKHFWQLTCVTWEVLLSSTKLLGSILVLVVVQVEELEHEVNGETTMTVSRPMFWCFFVLSLIVPRAVVYVWSACQQCARRQVSKNRKRFTEGDFDLDLAYISGRILAMSFPAQDLEAQFRNPMAEVQRFLQSRHPQHRVYNLCKEEHRRYDETSFWQVRRRITFFDHNVCPLRLLVDLVEEQHRFLAEEPKNVVVIHCKAGKGRTGLVCSCLLLREGLQTSATEALETYAERRTHDRKGITIPSQIRYVKLYAQILREGFIRTQSVRLKSVLLQNFLQLPGYRSSSFQVEVRDHEKHVLFSSGFGCAAFARQARVDSAESNGSETSDGEAESSQGSEVGCASPPLDAGARRCVGQADAVVLELEMPLLPDDFQVVLRRRYATWCGLSQQVDVMCSFWLNSGYVSEEMHLPLAELDYCRSLQHLCVPVSNVPSPSIQLRCRLLSAVLGIRTPLGAGRVVQGRCERTPRLPRPDEASVVCSFECRALS
ncbi:unnamed protein product [Durusdinium trenchii]|uniref:Phosphatidylinositol-3,4,5-trisphosphate 3-phosphatase n=1 Tax=Durusdinium trenchii TaxID=1381693 RepID=A0ABP0QB97_9DINO